MEFRAVKGSGERALWCFACRTRPRRAGGFVVVWHMLYLCVHECLLCIQRPFSKRQNKRQPKQIQHGTMKDKRKKEATFSQRGCPQTWAHGLDCNYWRSLKSTIVTSSFEWSCCEGTAKPRCRTSSERRWCQTHVSPHSPTEIDKTISGAGLLAGSKDWCLQSGSHSGFLHDQ